MVWMRLSYSTVMFSNAAATCAGWTATSAGDGVAAVPAAPASAASSIVSSQS